MQINTDHPFYELTPQSVMDAVESCGFPLTGEYIQLNSYENRVFDLKLEEPNSKIGKSIIAKFYRPGRWSKDCVQEEHDFMFDLHEIGFPAVAPLKIKKESLLVRNNMLLALFPKALGRMPQELSQEDFTKIGRSLARLHNCGEQKVARHRPIITLDDYGYSSLNLLEDWVAPEVWERYKKSCYEIFDCLEDHLEPESFIRIHGDCHKGNLLYTDQQEGPKVFFFVDFDDFCMGPAAQDFWMLFSSELEYQQELDWILAGYEELRSFPQNQFALFKALRGLRIIHYAAWIARRWQDPSFPRIFPDFEKYTYWAEETESLEKIAWSL